MGGRPRLMSPSQVEAARRLLADPDRPIADVCTAMRVSKATLYRYVPAGARRPAAPAPPTRVALQPAGGP
jgi:hypothetical protein